MSEAIQPSPSAQADNQTNTGKAVALTPELIQQITDKVYALLQRDLQIEQERARATRPPAQWRF